MMVKNWTQGHPYHSYIAGGYGKWQSSMQACLILMCFGLSHFAYTAFLTHWRSTATLCWTSLSAPFSSICSLSLYHILVILTIFRAFSLFSFLQCCDQWWWLKAQVIVNIFLAIKYFLIKVCTFFHHNAIVPLIDYSIL